MNVYISVPMSGRTVKEVEADIKAAKKDFAFNGKRTKFCSNIDIFKQHPDLDPLLGLATAIERMSDVDAIYVCDGWRKSKGCRIEVAIALLYSIPIYGIDAEIADNLEMIIRKKYQPKKNK